MNIKKEVKFIKGVAVAQSIIAPGLIVTGVILNNKLIKNIGIVWCGLVTVDTARTTCDAANVLYDGTPGWKNTETSED